MYIQLINIYLFYINFYILYINEVPIFLEVVKINKIQLNNTYKGEEN